MLSHTPGQLADIAGVGIPESEAGPGADWLIAIQDDVNGRDTDERAEKAAEDIASIKRGDSGGFASDHDMWRAWVDLRMYRVIRDMADDMPLHFDGSEISEVAYVAFGEVAQRLALALIEEGSNEDEDED